MDWDDLRYALAVADLGSLSAAADNMGVNASTVLRRIASLEGALGVRLFERDRTGYRLTQEGGELITSLRPVQERIAAISRGFTPEDDSIEAIVRMSAPAALASTLIIPRLGQFHSEQGGLSVHVLTTDGAPPGKLGLLDLSLSYGRPVEGDLLVRKLADIGYGLYATPELLARHRGKATLDDHLSRLPLVGFGPQAPLTAPVQWLLSNATNPKTVLRSDDAQSRFSAVISGVGMAILPCFLADGAPGVSRLCGPETVGQVELWLATHRETRHVSRLRYLVDFLAQLTRNRRQRLSGKN